MYAAFLPLALILAAGLCYKFIPGVLPAADVRRAIGSIVLNIFLPALTFFALYSTPLTSSLWTVPLTSTVVTLVGLGVAYLVYAVLLRRKLLRPAIGALLLASAWCNATYLGLPVVTSVIGMHVQQVPILFDLLAMTPLLFIAGTIIGVEYGSGNERHSLSEALKQLLRLPPMWAAAAGILLNAMHVALPVEVTTAFETAGRTVSPLMIFSVGLALRAPNIKRMPYILPSVVIRLGLGTLVGWFVASRLIDDPDVFKTTVLESAMPAMMLTMVFAERYGLDAELLAETIILSTIGAMITLPLIAHFL